MSAHAFLDEASAAKLVKFAEILRIRGKMMAVTDDALILLSMAMNGIPNPKVQAGDHHKVILFSDKQWSWLVVVYQGFTEGNGLAALKIDRKYLMNEFMVRGTFNPQRAQKIVNGMLCVMQVNPRDVEMDWRGIENKIN